MNGTQQNQPSIEKYRKKTRPKKQELTRYTNVFVIFFAFETKRQSTVTHGQFRKVKSRVAHYFIVGIGTGQATKGDMSPK